MPPDETELTVNLRNGMRAEQPLSEHAAAVRRTVVIPDPAIGAREDALARLQLAALEDHVLADLLTVLGLK